ncbi:MAG: serine/threonine protein kinase [Verrucomicrobia bacterium]|nr:serine/threonine protein kinase [Verrucomicrobiota bacterium]
MRVHHAPFVAAIAAVAAVPAMQSQGAEPVAEPVTFSATDWPWWRGPHRNGVADANQKPPLKWSDTGNILWKTPVPGRGHGSPIVTGHQIFLAAAEPDGGIQSLLCFDRQTGRELWKTEIHRGPFPKGNDKSSFASSTAACDGRRVFINFLHHGAVYTTALSREGKQLWQTKITDYVLHQGFPTSPAVFESLVIVSADNKGSGRIAALDRATGRLVWQHERPKFPNYASPIILHVAGREQLILSGCDLVTSLDPRSGRVIWEAPGSTTECVTSPVTDGRSVVVSGGYPKNHVAAIRGDGTGSVAWENTSRVYVPSMQFDKGHLFAVLDAGVAACWNFETGAEVWKGRLGGTFSASPVLVGDLLFAMNEAGRTFIFKATPAAFELVAENPLGHEAMATPTICGGRIYHRGASRVDGRRQEFLYCIGVKE